MSFNWQKYLSPGENIQKEFAISDRFCWLILIMGNLVAIMALFANVFAGIALFLIGNFYWYYLKKSKHYAFTNKRVLLVDQFLGLSAISIDYPHITDLQMDQSYFDQLMGWGTFTINTTGTNTPLINLSFVDHPQALKQSLDQIRETSASATKL